MLPPAKIAAGAMTGKIKPLSLRVSRTCRASAADSDWSSGAATSLMKRSVSRTQPSGRLAAW